MADVVPTTIQHICTTATVRFRALQKCTWCSLRCMVFRLQSLFLFTRRTGGSWGYKGLTMKRLFQSVRLTIRERKTIKEVFRDIAQLVLNIVWQGIFFLIYLCVCVCFFLLFSTSLSSLTFFSLFTLLEFFTINFTTLQSP